MAGTLRLWAAAFAMLAVQGRGHAQTVAPTPRTALTPATPVPPLQTQPPPPLRSQPPVSGPAPTQPPVSAPAPTQPVPGWPPPSAAPPPTGLARAERDQNFAHFELLGNAGLYSLNYTRIVLDDFAARIGISYVALGAGIERAGARADALTIPLTAHYLGVGSARHRLDLGLGALVLYASAEARAEAREIARESFTVVGTASVGYRYLPPSGFTFNIGFTPIFGPIFLPWGGMGIGHTF